MAKKEPLPLFYEEIKTPEFWTLLDLLYWASMRILPRCVYFGEEEGRQSSEALFEYPLSLGASLGPNFLTPLETDQLGLTQDPDWEDYQRDLSEEEYIHSPDFYEFMAKLSPPEDASEQEKVNWRRRLDANSLFYQKAIEIENKKNRWRNDLDDALDETICRLIIELKNGKITAEGIQIEKGSVSGVDWRDDTYEYIEFLTKENFDDAYSLIPHDRWVSRNVNWRGSYLETDTLVFLGVRLLAANAITLFPPIGKNKVELQSFGEYFFNLNNDSSSSRQRSQVGRPRKDAAAIHRKIALVFEREGGLIRKQDAFAQEIQNWYQKEFNDTVGISTIKAILSGYYRDPNFKKSEK